MQYLNNYVISYIGKFLKQSDFADLLTTLKFLSTQEVPDENYMAILKNFVP